MVKLLKFILGLVGAASAAPDFHNTKTNLNGHEVKRGARNKLTADVKQHAKRAKNTENLMAPDAELQASDTRKVDTLQSHRQEVSSRLNVNAQSVTAARIEYFFTQILLKLRGAQSLLLMLFMIFGLCCSFKLAIAGYHFSDPERQLRYIQLHRSFRNQQGKGSAAWTRRSLKSLEFEIVARRSLAPQEVIFPAINYRINFDTLPPFLKLMLCPI